MTFLPIVERELRVAARRQSTYRSRLWAAIAAICVAGWFLLAMARGGSSPAMLSQSIFGSLASFAFVYCLLAGIRNTADCLSEEKREGTLGLLFLTDLKGYDVVLGKLMATSLNAFYGLLAIFPVLSIPLLLGGVTASQFWMMSLCLVNTLFLSLSAALWVSAVSHHQRRAMTTAFLLILFIAAGLPLIGLLFRETHLGKSWPGIPMGCAYPSPAYAFGQAFDGRNQAGFWVSMTVIHLLGWGFLIFAGRVLPRAWQDRPATAKASRWRDKWIRWSYGSAGQRTAYQRRLLQVNPYYWLAARDRLKPAFLWLFLALVAFIWVWVCRLDHRRDWELGTTLALLLAHTTIKIWFASEAGHRLGADRHSGALELVLSTPLSVGDILRGQWLALKRQFAWPVFVVVFADLMYICAETQHPELMSTILVGLIMFVADIVTLGWVGMWLGLAAKQSTGAIGGAIARILLLPWAIWLGGVILVAFSSRGAPPFGPKSFVGSWFVIGIVNNLVYLIWARSNLHRRFRDVVTRQFDPDGGRRWHRRPPTHTRPGYPPAP